MKKNDRIILQITDMTQDGEGIGHIETNEGGNLAVFVKDAVVGDLAEVIITKPKKHFAYGKLAKVLRPGPDRVEPACPVAARCGGCRLMQLDYGAQLVLKQKKVEDCLSRIGGMKQPGRLIEGIRGMELPYRFRNKMQFPVGLDKNGEVQIGFYAGRTHSIVDIDRCVIGHPVNDYIVKALREWIRAEQKRTGAFVYDEEHHRGLLRHIVTRVGYATGELMVCLVINGTAFSKKMEEHERICSALRRTLTNAVDRYEADRKKVTPGSGSGNGLKPENGKGEQTYVSGDIIQDQKISGISSGHFSQVNPGVTLASVILNSNPEKTNRILGTRCETLYGRDVIYDEIGGIRFAISALSFFQVNPIQTGALYEKAVSYAGLTGNEVVWDLYCGIGTISLSLAKKARRVYGVEIVPEAVEDAKKNAALNHMDHAEFFVGKAEEILLPEQPDVIVTDPPRKGMEQSLVDTILRVASPRVVYVSCDPATLARDLALLTATGVYEVRRIALFDQFCHSMHVEVVSLLQRVSNTRERTITLDVDMEDYHRIKNGMGVTADATK